MKLFSFIARFQRQRQLVKRIRPLGAELRVRIGDLPARIEPLTPSEQDELDELLSQLPDNSIHCLTMLDGFLTAMVIGPAIKWEIWLGVLFQRGMLDGEPGTRLLRLSLRHFLALAEALHQPTPRFRPLFIGYTQAKSAKPVGRRLQTIHEWCYGLILGASSPPWAWDGMFPLDDGASLLHLPWLLGTEEGTQHQMQDIYEYYETQGYDGDEIEEMALLWLSRPSTHRSWVSALKKDILSIRDYWHRNGRR